MRKTRILIALILCLMFAAVFSPAPASAQEKITYTNVLIYENDYEYHSLWALNQDEEIDVSVDVTSPSGGLIDVYILSSSHYSSYPDGVFTPTIEKEGVSSTDFTFKAPDDATYYLIIDNEDNSRSTDAVPVGDVTVSYEYDDPIYASIQDIEEAAEAFAFGCLMIVVIAVIIIVVIIVVVIFLIVRKPKEPAAQAPAPYPQQPPYQQPQQPYQPPPGQQPPYQPPPGQQPPPY